MLILSILSKTITTVEGVNNILIVEFSADTATIRCVVQINEGDLSCKIRKVYKSKNCSLYLSRTIENSYTYMSDMVDISFLKQSEQYCFVITAENTTTQGIIAILEGSFTTQPHSGTYYKVIKQ